MFQDVGKSRIVRGRGPEGDGKDFIVIIIYQLQEACPGDIVFKYQRRGAYFLYFARLLQCEAAV